MLNAEARYALLLSTVAGLSTSIGGALAVIRRPGQDLLAFLLGMAIGVMVTLSAAEMVVRNALEHGPWVLVSAGAGAAAYYLLQPYLPDFENHGAANGAQGERSGAAAKSATAAKAAGGAAALREAERPQQQQQQRSSPRAGDSGAANAAAANEQSSKLKAAARSRELLRLGLLMAATMTAHNLPEGLAVAFSAYTGFGAQMAFAIAMHNIPEGIIVAAPVYAATGSRWKALAMATASGLSEPVGALAALLALKPFLTPLRLQHVLALVGGLMMAVCALELWPEARKCRADWRLAQGVAVGAALLGWTLLAGA